MSARFEAQIRRWYERRHTGLEYLDLAEVPNPSRKQLSHNQAVIHDVLSLHANNTIRNFKLIQEKQLEVDNRLTEIEKSVKHGQGFQKAHKPLGREEVLRLVQEISQQPKRIEEKTERLSEELAQKLAKVEALVNTVHQTVNEAKEMVEKVKEILLT